MQHQHIGAYGILKREGGILLVRKARGPFTGLLDLPGGGIEFGEDPIQALRREFLEETGLTITGVSLLVVLSNRVSYQLPSGESEDLHHIGVIYTVSAIGSDTLRTGPDGEDSDGAIWMPAIDMERSILTPFALGAIDLASRSTELSKSSISPLRSQGS